MRPIPWYISCYLPTPPPSPVNRQTSVKTFPFLEIHVISFSFGSYQLQWTIRKEENVDVI